MPVVDLKPNGTGIFNAWSITGAATAWQALADESASTFVSDASGALFRVTFEDLPGTATGVTSVALAGVIGQESPGTNQSAAVLATAANVTVQGASFTPTDGGSSEVVTAFPLAPGALAWNVARANAVEGAMLNVVASGTTTILERLRLRVDYTDATAVPANDPAPVKFPDAYTAAISFPGTPEVAFYDAQSATISFPHESEVAFPDPDIPEIRMSPERD